MLRPQRKGTTDGLTTDEQEGAGHRVDGGNRLRRRLASRSGGGGGRGERSLAEAGSPSPPRSPETPVHDRALLGLRRLEPLVGDLLLKGETLVFRVRLLVTDVQAVTAVRVGIAVDDVAVLRLRDQLQGRHRMELLRSLRRVGWLRREPG